MQPLLIIALLITIGLVIWLYRNREPSQRPQFVNTLRTVGIMLWNKGAAILVLLWLLSRYYALGDDPTPFAELLYACILAASIIVVAPIVRLLVFPEAAEYAESGQLRKDIATGLHPHAIRHYWFATGISYLVPALCAVSLL